VSIKTARFYASLRSLDLSVQFSVAIEIGRAKLMEHHSYLLTSSTNQAPAFLRFGHVSHEPAFNQSSSSSFSGLGAFYLQYGIKFSRKVE